MTNLEQKIRAELPNIWKIRYDGVEDLGWNVLLRQKYGYFTPDEYYSAVLSHYVTPQTNWLDVGCGRHILPHNHNLATILAARCKSLTGIDPSDNVDSNPFLHGRQQTSVEDFKTDAKFDLISLRMVAEHVEKPDAAIAAFRRLLAPGGRVIIYTVYKWSPASLLAAATPMSVHHWAKKILWRTEEIDTFPVVYAMNTRPTLNRLFKSQGFEEELFMYLDDCRSFQRWKATSVLELTARDILRAVKIPYPDLSLLAVFRRPL